MNQINIESLSLLKTLDLETQHVFDMMVHLQIPLDVGSTPKGNRQILIGDHGVFKGGRLEGRILPNGADWFLVRPDGVGELDVRLVLRTDDEELIYMRSKGFLKYSREMAKAVLSGTAEPSDYYFRERTVFETGSEKYGWLNSVVAVGTGWYRPGMVGMSIYEIR
jgi:uncharacterized protein DUF3237